LVADAENWAESAITDTPHISPTAITSPIDWPNTRPMPSAQPPLTTMDAIVTAVRPTRSAAQPPPIAPSDPAATTANVANAGGTGGASP